MAERRQGDGGEPGRYDPALPAPDALRAEITSAAAAEARRIPLDVLAADEAAAAGAAAAVQDPPGLQLASLPPSLRTVQLLLRLADPRRRAAVVDGSRPDAGVPRQASPEADEAELLLGIVQAWDSVVSWATAQREAALHAAATAVAALPTGPGSPRRSGSEAAAAELSAALRISPRSVDAAIDRARRLQELHRGTRWLLEDGLVTPAHARAVLDECSVLADPVDVSAVESLVLRDAPKQSPAELRRAVRRAVARVDPDGERARAESARTHQVAVTKVNLPDALAMVTAILPAPAAVMVMAGLDAVLGAHPDAGELADDLAADSVRGREGRTLAAMRADALTFLCSSVAADPSVVPGLAAVEPQAPAIGVTISVSALLGLSDESGELAGYGPIPADLARELAADGVWARLLVDSLTGQLLDSTPHRYRPGSRLRSHVVARDITCRFPSCPTPASRCDLDHTPEFDHERPDRGGTTTRRDLRAGCRRHHNCKTWHGWRTSIDPDGTLVHRTPLGRTYRVPIPPQPTALR
ncbi:uncharacterized protein DUF222 [Motilibacter peucedani]|uniref:Uncharacterized protein DUF222 n=1 Tax=Motilibacter peucedani TaxID=598650 RepID=A0A420XLQ0_9ACTN|nr:HNH endonuclease signature motif containing protein [Motilibacter peucedani]RKS71454.1 uncharacterized protein DUF222 [Motilibacter peucedani]